jgi:hypothetical protein
MKIESNLSSVIQNLSFKINSLEDSDKLFRTAAFDSVALISDRVQQDGLKTNDTLIKSFYSKGYGQKRRKNGLQTQFVDLTFSGDMMGDFVPAPIIGGWAAGFRSQKQGDKADWNEERFGTIFNLSADELSTVTKGINDYINATLR